MPRLKVATRMKAGSVCSAGRRKLARLIQSLTDYSYSLIPPRRCWQSINARTRYTRHHQPPSRLWQCQVPSRGSAQPINKFDSNKAFSSLNSQRQTQGAAAYKLWKEPGWHLSIPTMTHYLTSLFRAIYHWREPQTSSRGLWQVQQASSSKVQRSGASAPPSPRIKWATSHCWVV